MKKTLFLIFTLISLLFSSCSKKAQINPVNFKPIEIENKNATISVNPKTEILMIAFRLNKISYYSNHYFDSDDYVSGIDKMFEKQKDHEFVKLINDISKKNKYSLEPLFQLTNYISDDLTQISFTKKNIPEELKEYFSKLDLSNFIIQMNDFAKVSNFERIWILYEKQLKSYVINVNDFYEKNPKLLSYFFDYYYQGSSPKVCINVSPLLNYHNFALPYSNTENKQSISFFQSPDLSKEQSGNDVNIFLYFSEFIFSDQFLRNYDKYENILKSFADPIFKDNNFNQKLRKIDYINSCAFYLSFFPSFTFIDDCLEGEYQSICLEALKSNFISDDLLIMQEAFTEYENNRQKYPTIQSFFDNYFINYIQNFNK